MHFLQLGEAQGGLLNVDHHGDDVVVVPRFFEPFEHRLERQGRLTSKQRRQVRRRFRQLTFDLEVGDLLSAAFGLGQLAQHV